jgi:hypothetical protein
MFFGLPSDPFEGVDAAYPDLEEFVPRTIRGPQLIDGTREALCDLPLTVDLQGAPGEVEPREERRATQDLC